MQEITREIEIDAGHRIPNHKSACRSFHGHRYKIQATVSGEICVEEGSSEEGMVVDFGFLKELMMHDIHGIHDHGMMLWVKDIALPRKLTTSGIVLSNTSDKTLNSFVMHDDLMGKLIIMNFIPTAENLARYFFALLSSSIKEKGLELTNVRVYETPNCWADYNRKLK
jgi:6-pyruvoyltetrahydropterin/6-carboxytetrahydropterin synthase